MRSIIPHESNPALRKKAEAVLLKDIDGKRIKTLISDMKRLLAEEEYGVALAAPQVGESVRIFVVSGKAVQKRTERYDDVEKSESDATPSDLPAQAGDEVFINPVLTKVSRGKKDKHEGCLSIRGKWGLVPRAEKATVTAYNEKGRKFTRGASGLLAHIFQHEMDHLDGVLYIDRAKEVLDDGAIN